MAAPKKVLMVLTSHGVIEGTETATGWYLPELAHPYFKFVEAGFAVTVCSIKGGDTTVAPSSLDMEDAENKKFWETAELKALTQGTAKLDDFKGSDFDCVYYVGGFGTMWDFFDASVDRVGREVYEAGGIVGAVCHGPIALANIKLSNGEMLVKGKQCTAFCNEEEAVVGLLDQLPERDGGRSCEDILKQVGGNFSKTDAWGCYALSDNRVITGQNPASAGKTGELVVAALS